MNKQFLYIILVLIGINSLQAQTKGTRVGYIDMEYILQNVPDYTDAQKQLDLKAEKWKQEIETKKNEINKLKESLTAEKSLLTKGLIEERDSEIKFLENEVLDYQQKRFGPNGDLMTQKISLAKPIQDQVFSMIQDIAEAKKYDFIFDKTSDLTMLFAAKKFDISDQIIRVLNRTEKREQLTKKQLKEEEAKEAKEDAISENPILAEREKALDERKAARDKVVADRLQLQEDRRKASEERKQQIAAEKEAKKNGTVSEDNNKTDSKTVASPNTTEPAKDSSTAASELKQKQAEDRAKALEERNRVVEERKKALEERRKKVLEEREAAKEAKDSLKQ